MGKRIGGSGKEELYYIRSWMFVSGMDLGREAGRPAVPMVLMPMRFVWPYGGSSVYLCGSFTR